MEKSKTFAVLTAMAMGLAVFGYGSGDSNSGTEQLPERFVKIPAVSITGSKIWTSESKIFVSGRKLEIASSHMSNHKVTCGEYKVVMG